MRDGVVCGVVVVLTNKCEVIAVGEGIVSNITQTIEHIYEAKIFAICKRFGVNALNAIIQDERIERSFVKGVAVDHCQILWHRHYIIPSDNHGTRRIDLRLPHGCTGDISQTGALDIDHSIVDGHDLFIAAEPH